MRKKRNISGAQIRKFRTLNNMSQSDLAAACQRAGWNVSRDVIASIESRSRILGDAEIVFLAKILRVTILDIFPDRIDAKDVGNIIQ